MYPITDEYTFTFVYFVMLCISMAVINVCVCVCVCVCVLTVSYLCSSFNSNTNNVEQTWNLFRPRQLDENIAADGFHLAALNAAQL